ncbi:hypothetical protein [Candidatus Thiodictyon syntrophicum]|jgi:hypothetical protein|uniref:Uncharacterized protein n=1 Tax=Candidatus Thiodictyon syntrophicum TaxID=1166950 RepID=A0A2K8U610_9GAMM|nr:hypothetical protein [Candidatus Thiodictyon syntrophicum]AUB81013.1 hypothetical protein THSYN_08650 [Candidatus Thiodictyon syntrophicum]
MNSSRKIASVGQGGADEIQETRRRLLRAAAAAAPLVATLPSGAAYALGSTSQCIKDDRSNSQAVDFNPALGGTASPDGFARVQGYQYTFRKGTERPPVTLIVFSIGASANPPYYFGSSGSIGSYSYTVGEVFDPATFAASVWTMTVGPDAVQLLKLYRAASDTGDADSNPTCAVDCLPASTDPQSRCIFPVSQIGPPDAPGQNPGNNMGLTTSCLTSVHPISSGRSCPQ